MCVVCLCVCVTEGRPVNRPGLPYVYNLAQQVIFDLAEHSVAHLTELMLSMYRPQHCTNFCCNCNCSVMPKQCHLVTVFFLLSTLHSDL